MNVLDWIDNELAELRARDLHRELPSPLVRVAEVVESSGRPLVNFSTNDYLNLASHHRLVEAAIAATQIEGVGRGASPLVSGRAPTHLRLEQRLAQFEGVEAALLFPTGYAANLGTIPALIGRGDAIYGDARNHASIIDGCRLARADRHIYPHRDVAALARLLAKGNAYRRRLIVTDTLFSMDGDLAPLPELAELAERYGAMLMVDEAHATGVFGPAGRGVVSYYEANHPGISEQIAIRVGTLSKALGSAGGFVCGSTALIDWLANRARSFVFSTAHPTAASAAAVAALDLVAGDPLGGQRLLKTAAWLRGRLQALGWSTGTSDSQIVPIYVGAPERAVALASRLRQAGYWTPAIRPPSVPQGESLLRLSLTSGHTRAMLTGLLETLGPAEG